VQLAERVGVKRQAIYDMESGRYMPNTLVSLKLARALECRVEDLFMLEPPSGERPVTPVEFTPESGPRVSLVKVRERLIAYPLDDRWMSSEGFQPADGFLLEDGRTARLLHGEETLAQKALLLGCDPAFAILGGHVAQTSRDARLQCRFASSRRALDGLHDGHAHMGGIHFHNVGDDESNLQRAREALGGLSAKVIAFSRFEEGLMVARGNPRGIKGVEDLANRGVHFVNREPGAALRTLLDDTLRRLGIAPEDVDGFDELVFSHNEGARRIALGLADAALGLRAVSSATGLGFVPLETVRCDLVVPLDFMDHPTVRTVLEVLQTRALKQELGTLPGYESTETGNIIGEI
jgi:molybdate-binding protein/DNA-binding XRE family transcriptional regulator